MANDNPPLTPADPDAALLALADIVTPFAIRVAVTLGLPRLITEGITAPATLATRTGAHPRALAGLVRYLVAKGIFVEAAPGSLALSPVGEKLLTPGARLMLSLDEAGGHMSLAWAGLLAAVRSGSAGYPAVFGRGFWETLDAEPALAASFDAYMAGWAAQWVPDVVHGRDWSSVRHVVDVGGGAGRLLTALLQAWPALRGTLVELPGSAARARAALNAADVADRATVVEGSFFDPLPCGGDVYLLAQVVHDWPDADAIRILRRCAEAARPGGRVLLVERLVDETPGADAARMDLFMLVLFGGAERSRAGFAALADAADLALADIRPAGHGLHFLECTPRP